MPDIAFLVYSPLRDRLKGSKQNRYNASKKNTFDNNKNIGAHVVKDCLERAGFAVGFCAPETASQYRLVLVSFTSPYDMYAFYRQVALRPDWQPVARRFTVLGGGAGMQNPTAVRRFLDYAVFGRCEEFIAEVAGKLLDRQSVTHESVMHVPDLHAVTIAQVPEVYAHTVRVPNLLSGEIKDGTGGFSEAFMGCPWTCKFCHYTYARQRLTSQNHNQRFSATQYAQVATNKAGGQYTWDAVMMAQKKPAGRVLTALDGTSQRLRYLYGKRISDADIVMGIEHLSTLPGETPKHVMQVYNIGNFPSETKADWDGLYAVLRRVRPAQLVHLCLSTTPFTPSLVTPMQWEKVSLWPNLRPSGSLQVIDTPRFHVFHSAYNGSPWSQFESVLVQRATVDSDALFHAMCFAPKLRQGNVAQRIHRLQSNFDLTPYLRQYDLDEPPPAAFLSTYVRTEQLRKIARKMRQQVQRTIDEPGWLPPGKTMFEVAEFHQKA